MIRLHENATLPSKGTEKSAGFDLYAILDQTIPSNQARFVRTGLAVHVQDGIYVRIAMRSSLAKKEMIVLNDVVENDQEICVLVYNLSQHDFHLNQGERFAQMILQKCISNAIPTEIGCLKSTSRGEGGFGSTGK